MGDLPETTYAVLGLVDKVPGSSGYDLVALASRSFAHFWPVSQTLLYRELARLVERGWVAATRVDQMSAPTKWTYKITEGGRDALEDWLSAPPSAISTFRSGWLLRFFFAHRMPAELVRSLLAGYRGALQDQCDELTAIVDKLAAVSTPAARSGRLAARHGLVTALARLRWIDEVEAELGEDQPG